MRSRGYIYTLNNYTQEEVSELKAIESRYHVLGEEKGELDTPHIQGYILFKNARSFKAVKKLIPRAHIEAQKGTCEQAIEYCKKDGSYQELGTMPMSRKEKGEGEQKRYQRAWELAKAGDIEEIDPDIRMRLYGTIKRIKEDYQKDPGSMPYLDFHWYYGDSGTGKSKKAREENPNAYIKNPNKWWDGYVDQECVIIDEWSPCHEVLANHLKKWADHHSFNAERKGGHMCIRPKKIIITSNYSIDECFLNPQDSDPIKRRFKVLHFNKPLNQ